MKVLFVTREGYELSGARVRCFNFARELSKLGIEAEVFSYADQLGAKYGEDELRMSGVDKCRLIYKALRSLQQFGGDTIFILQRMNYHALAPIFMSFFRKNKVIFDCDDWNIRENPVYYLGFFPSSKMEYVTRLIAKRANACIAASLFLRDYLMNFNSKTYYLPTGVDTDFFCTGQGRNDPKITFSWIGTAFHKEMGENIRFLLSCFSAIADQNENVFLSLAGKGKYFDEIRGNMSDYKHKAKVTFHSWISPDNVPEYLSSIDIGLLPLVQETKFNKAKSPTKLFEYMSMAKATISSDIGEARNIIRNQETGLLAKNRESFITGMQILIDNPKLRYAMGAQARQEVEMKYSLKVLSGRLAEIISGI